jgi:hypothetical protein
MQEVVVEPSKILTLRMPSGKHAVVVIGRRFFPDVYKAVEEHRVPVIPTVDSAHQALDPEVVQMDRQALAFQTSTNIWGSDLMQPGWAKCEFHWNIHDQLVFFQVVDTYGASILRIGQEEMFPSSPVKLVFEFGE